MNTRRYILDTNILLRFPEALAKGNRDSKILIPQAVVKQLQGITEKNRKFAPISSLLSESVSKGVVKVIETVPLDPNDLVKLSNGSLDFTDFEIGKTVEHYANNDSNKNDVYFVTEDIKFSDHLKSCGINSIGLAEFISHSKNLQVVDSDIEAKAKNIKRKLILSVVGSIVSGLLGSLTATSSSHYIQFIIATINIWGTVLCIPLIGIGFYVWRLKQRLSYGVFEAFVGLIVAIRVFFPAFDLSKLDIVSLMQIIAGVYVMVRGMDNIQNGVKDTLLESAWKKLFRIT